MLNILRTLTQTDCMNRTCVFTICILIFSSCGILRNDAWKLERTGKHELDEIETSKQSQPQLQDQAQLNNDELVGELKKNQFFISEITITQKDENEVIEKIDFVRPQVHTVKRDSLRAEQFPYRHKYEIVIAKNGSGYVFLFILSAALLFIPAIFYAFNVHDPREPKFRAEKYVRIFRGYKVFYVIDCLGAIALSVIIIMFGEPAGGVFLLLLIPGIIALIASHKLQKRAAELAVSLTEPDADQRLEEHKNTLYRLKMWRWIGFVGMIPFVFVPIWVLIELADLIAHADR